MAIRHIFAVPAFAFGTMLAGQVAATPIQNACLASERAAGNRALCACIQNAADMTLQRSDQRRAAGFFNDPHQAQVVRTSRTQSDNAFWERYRAFGAAAEALCAR